MVGILAGGVGKFIDEALAVEIVRLLERAGELPKGTAKAPVYGESARAALVRFMHRENLENRVREDGSIDRQTLEYLRRFSEP